MINNATGKAKQKPEARLAYTKIGFFLSVYGGDSCPAAPIRRTSHARKSTDPDTESIGRWIDRSRVVSPSTEALIVLEENKRHCVCLHSISLGHAGPRGYLIWDDMWGSCRRLDGVRADLRKTRRVPLARVFFLKKRSFGESW